jgi:hypothetical protein
MDKLESLQGLTALEKVQARFALFALPVKERESYFMSSRRSTVRALKHLIFKQVQSLSHAGLLSAARGVYNMADASKPHQQHSTLHIGLVCLLSSCNQSTAAVVYYSESSLVYFVLQRSEPRCMYQGGKQSLQGGDQESFHHGSEPMVILQVRRT